VDRVLEFFLAVRTLSSGECCCLGDSPFLLLCLVFFFLSFFLSFFLLCFILLKHNFTGLKGTPS
jgi:hypothetical protein